LKRPNTRTDSRDTTPRVNGVLETCLHVEDVERSARFYQRLFGFRRMASDDRFCAFDVARGSVLLLFRRGGTLEPVQVPGGLIPPHDGSGRMHLAFAIPAAQLTAWQERLNRAGIAIESRVRWQGGSESLYFRDPDQHLVELATPGIWPNYQRRASHVVRTGGGATGRAPAPSRRRRTPGGKASRPTARTGPAKVGPSTSA